MCSTVWVDSFMSFGTLKPSSPAVLQLCRSALQDPQWLCQGCRVQAWYEVHWGTRSALLECCSGQRSVAIGRLSLGCKAIGRKESDARKCEVSCTAQYLHRILLLEGNQMELNYVLKKKL